MKISKEQFNKVIISIAILLVAVVITVLDAVIPLNIWVHPILTFLFVIFIGFGVLLLVLGLKKASPWFLFLSAILLGLAFLYAFICSFAKFWYLGIIIVAVILTIIALLSFVRAGNKTEDIALNKSQDYKNYEQRKAEKEKAEREKEEKPLPEIKSFKDNK